ncbi:hypothetical protein RINTU1_08160 [Candidatus Regiella insecticola]|uniref:Uncharacterized protein n=1 Tax=Candidatus Regiella insecticola TaxID=138073 RepID=A0A6L2ZLX9_9ENTR|nr:hypothetical protein RINTU1_08160 [Candidatus Regiella insecticola]
MKERFYLPILDEKGAQILLHPGIMLFIFQNFNLAKRRFHINFRPLCLLLLT